MGTHPVMKFWQKFKNYAEATKSTYTSSFSSELFLLPQKFSFNIFKDKESKYAWK